MKAAVTVLGSGTGVPSSRRAPPGLLLQIEGEGPVLIDPGPGSLARTAAGGVPVTALDRVLLTHHHPDHTLDLISLLFARHNPWLKPRLKKLTVVGPRGTRALYEGMKALYGTWVQAGEEELEIVEVEVGPLPREARIQGAAHKTDHTEHSLGYRLELPAGTVALSGDTGPCEALVDLGRKADLYFLECAVPDRFGDVKGHMTPSTAGRIAAQAEPVKLVLYHLYPPVEAGEALESVRAIFPGEAVIAEDGAVFDLPER